MKPTVKERLRIVGAIAAKDIVDAVKNRTTLSIIIGTLTLLLSSMALPFLGSLNRAPTALAYDPGSSTLVRAMTTREEFRLRLVSSMEDLAEAIAGAPELRLGLIIPEDFAVATGLDGAVEIRGLAPHWAKPAAVLDLVTLFERELSEASWQDVHIVLSEPIYPAPTHVGQHSMTANTIAIATLTLGLALVPGLLTEEKETHTLESLLVSPARYGEIIAGKAIVGALYGAVAAALAVGVNGKWFIHGWLVVLAVGLGILFTVTVGTLLGLLIDNANTTNVWMGLVLMLLLMPALIGTLLGSGSDGVVQTIIEWIPTSAISRLLALAMSQPVHFGDWWLDALRLISSIAVLVPLVVWRVRRLDERM